MYTKKTLATALEVLRVTGNPLLIGSATRFQSGLSFNQAMSYTKANLVEMVERKAKRHGAEAINALLNDIAKAA